MKRIWWPCCLLMLSRRIMRDWDLEGFAAPLTHLTRQRKRPRLVARIERQRNAGAAEHPLRRSRISLRSIRATRCCAAACYDIAPRALLSCAPATIGTSDVRLRHHPRKPPRTGDLALSPAAHAQPGRLVALGTGGAGGGAAC